MEELSRNLPLYLKLGFRDQPKAPPFHNQEFVKTPHVGLLFDKYLDTWGADFDFQKPLSDKKAPKKRQQGGKRCFYEEFLEFYKDRQKENDLSAKLDDYRQHRAALVKALGGQLLTAKTDWRFVSGLGVGHPFEVGFIWHRTLSVPYLPGSSVKGLIRAWASEWKEEDQDTVTRLFGPKGEQAAEHPDTGHLIVFDALPETLPKLELDIMNPHYEPYYQNSSKEPPADYHSPVPVFFIAVAAKTSFEFALAPRRPQEAGAKGDLAKGLELLREALEVLGGGGKTAVGYGRMIDAEIWSPNPTLEEKVYQAVGRWSLNELAENIGKKWKKTLEDLGVALDVVKAAVESRPDIKTISEWQNSDKENQKKAYKRLFGGNTQ